MRPRLALFEFRMIGDAVMALPFIRSVQEKYDVYVCCTPSGLEVFSMVLPPEKILYWRPPWVDEAKKYGSSSVSLGNGMEKSKWRGWKALNYTRER